MSVDAGTAVLKIRPDMAGLDREVSSGIGGVAKKAAGLFAAAFVVTKSIDFFKSAVDEAREAQKVGAQTAAVIASTGGAAGISAKHVEELASKLSTLDGVDREAVASSENLLLTFSRIKGVNFDRATASVQDMAAALGEDAKSAAIQLGKALSDPVKGIASLRRVGILFTDDQKKVIEAMVETGNVAGAQGVLLDEVAREFGGSAAAQADPIKRLGIAWDNIKRQVGQAVLPVLEKAATFLSGELPVAIDVAGAAFGWVGGIISDFTNTFQHASDGLTSSGFSGKVEEIAIAARKVFDQVKAGLEAFVGGWENADAKISPGVDGLTSTMLGLGAAARKVWDQIQNVITGAAKVIRPVLAEIGDYLSGHLQPIIFSIGAAFGILTLSGVVGLVVDAITALIAVAAPLVAALDAPVVAIGAVIAGLIYADTQFKIFRTVVNGVAAWLVASVKTAFGKVKNAIDDFIIGWHNAGVEIGRLDTFTAAFVRLGQLAKAAFDKVKNAVDDFVIGWHNAGVKLDGLSTFTAVFVSLGQDAKAAFDKVKNGIDDFVIGWHNAGVKMSGLDTFTATLVGLGQDAKRIFNEAQHAIDDFVIGWNNAGVQLGGLDAFTATLVRLGQGAHKVFDDLKGWAGDVVDFFKAHPGLGIDLGAFAAGGAVGVGISELIQHWREIEPVLAATLDWIQANVVPVVVAVVTETVTQFGNLVAWVQTEWPKIQDAIGNVINWIQANVIPVAVAVVSFLIDQFGHLIAWVVTEWPKMSEAITHVMNVIMDVVSVIAGIVGVAVAAVLFVWEHGHDQILAIAEATWSTIQAVVSAAVEIVKDIIDLVLNLINGDWGAAWHDILDIFSTIWGLIVTVAGNFITILWNLFIGAMAVLGAIVEAGLIAVVGWFLGLPGEILGALAGLAGLLVSVGSSLINGLLSGAISAAEGLWGWLRSIPGAVLGVFWDIGSTLRDAGRRLIQGFIDGVESMAGSVAGAVASVIPGGSSVAGFLGRHFAVGGIVDHPLIAQIGEAGREVVIPLTRPARAMELARDSGLLAMLTGSMGGGSADSSPAAPGVSGITFNGPVTIGNDGVIADLDWYSKVRFAGL